MTHHDARTPPGWAYPLVFIGGSILLLPWLRCWLKRSAQAGVVFHAALPWVLPWVVSINWLFIAVFWLAWNGVFGFLFLVFKPPLRHVETYDSRIKWVKRGLGAALALLPFGCMLVALEQYVADGWWSGFYPVNASLDSISFEVLTLWQNFGLLLLFVCLHAARTCEVFTPTRLLVLLGFSFTSYFIASQLYLGLMAIPAWQLIEREVFTRQVEHARNLVYHLLTFIAIPLLTASVFRRWLERKPFAAYWVKSLATLVLALFGLSFASGMPIYYALLMGMQQEKNATPEKAISWYAHGLTWSRSDRLNAYLQFHMGLLWRKQGRIDLAHDAFLKVLVNYPHDNDLLVMAHEFRARLEDAGADSAIRKVIPGIEARTEYKNAYCVPNSLGLVLNYWGDRTGAKTIGAEITQLDQGSFITDAVHFAERRGFLSLVLPLRDMQDIFKLVDHGFPVLTFIPGHVLAVFGYDNALRTLVTYDVNTVDIWDDQRWSVFQRDWSKQFNTLAVVIPENKLQEVEKILGDQILAKSEAYIQYLLASLLEDDVDGQARYYQKTDGHGLFFAAWEREQLLGEGKFSDSDNKSARSFIMAYSLAETERLGYLRWLYSMGHCAEALEFIAKYKSENTLEQSVQWIQAGCLNRLGLADSAVQILTNEVSTEMLSGPLFKFLLQSPAVREDADMLKEIGLETLKQTDGVDGETAELAIQGYLENLGSEPSEVEDAIDVLEGYLTRHNPYDTLALRALEARAGNKRFKPEQEFERDAFQKRLDLLRERRVSLER
jgi:hypothetical protein